MIKGPVAQLGERHIRIVEARSSILLGSIFFFNILPDQPKHNRLLKKLFITP